MYMCILFVTHCLFAMCMICAQRETQGLVGGFETFITERSVC